MSGSEAISAAAAPSPRSAGEIARLKRAATQLEGVFVQQLFKAMRETVPQEDGAMGGSGEEMFTSLFDQQLSDSAPLQWHRGVGEAIFARLAPGVRDASRAIPADGSAVVQPNLPALP